MILAELTTAAELGIRLGCFAGVLLALVGWERVAPRRAWSQSRGVRWFGNLGLVVLDALAVRLIFGSLVAVGVALIARDRGWGLFNALDAPYAVAFAGSVVVLDFVVYLQHVMFHAVPLLWRFHRVHHADLDFDATTGVRFHPVEVVLSMGLKVAVVAALGPPAMAVLTFEVLLNATSMFNHANLRLPAGLDRVLRLVVVTPDMHRVHHSIDTRETNSNFGFSFPWWDRLCGTYKPQPDAGHEHMTVGIGAFREPRYLRLHWLLALPFVGRSGDVPIGGKWRQPKA